MIARTLFPLHSWPYMQLLSASSASLRIPPLFFETLAPIRSGGVDCLTGKLKAQYGADFQNYLLQGAIYDTDRWCAGRETPEHNARQSVRAFLEREANKPATVSRPSGEKPERDAR